MKKKEGKKKKLKNPRNQDPCHSLFSCGDHLRFGIICSPIWGSFLVWGSFAVGDYLRHCTVLLNCFFFYSSFNIFLKIGLFKQLIWILVSASIGRIWNIKSVGLLLSSVSEDAYIVNISTVCYLKDFHGNQIFLGCSEEVLNSVT